LAASYYNYATTSNTVPGKDISEMTNPANNVNYYNNGYAIGSPYYRTVVGEFEASDSPYGTFDQNGNVWEWNETSLFGSQRGVRGGPYDFDSYWLQASTRSDSLPGFEHFHTGFRVASVAGLAADYNNNGFVDAADYVLWRKGGPLQNEVDTPGTVNAADYTAWRERFGNSNPGSGGGLGGTTVPEPTTLSLILAGIAGSFTRRVGARLM